MTREEMLLLEQMRNQQAQQALMAPTPGAEQNMAMQAALAKQGVDKRLAEQAQFLAQREAAMKPSQAVGPAPGSRPPNPFVSGLSQLSRRAMDYLGDPAARARLAAGLQSMTLNPNQAFILSQVQRGQDIQARRQAGREINQTASFLRAQGRDDLAAIIEQNPSVAPMILKSMFDKPEGVVVSEGEQIVDPATGQVLFGGQQPGDGFTSRQREEAGKLRKDYEGSQSTKDFQKQSGAYDRVVTSADKASAAGDLALIFNFMKVLDPGSVVRESEFATAAQARAALTRAEKDGTRIPAVVAQAMQRLETGQLLLPEQRNDFLIRAGMLYQGAANQHAPYRQYYMDQINAVAPGYGLPPVGYTGDVFLGDNEAPEPVAVLTTPPASWGGTDATWLSLTDDEKRQYLEDE